MQFQPGQSGNLNGRPRGAKNKRTLEGEAFAREIIDDPDVRKKLLAQAQSGELPPDILKTLLFYAFGKTVEVVDSGSSDNQRAVTIHF